MANRPPHLSFREEPKRGDVRARPQVCPGRALAGRRYVILLVHGFNNNQDQAREAYDGFQSLQRELGGLNADQPVADGYLVEFYWPGDVGWLSFINYEDSLERCIRIARTLGPALRRAVGHNDPVDVDVVAHSMGCRLTLELIRSITAEPGLSVRRMVFMAAAVPTFLLEINERLRNALDHPRIEAVMSLFSSDDWVLGNAFPAGQWDAHGESWTNGEAEWQSGTVALGHGRWITGDTHRALGPENQVQITGAGHSDYWGWRERTRDRQGKWANALIKDFLGFTAAGARETATRNVGERDTLPAREPVDERDMAARVADGSEGERCIDV